MDWRTALLLAAAAVLASIAAVGISAAVLKWFALSGAVNEVIEFTVLLVLFVVLARLFGVT